MNSSTSPQETLTLNCVRLASIGHPVGEDQAVLAVDEVLDGAEHGFIEEDLLAGLLVEDLGEGELVVHLTKPPLAALEGKAALRRTHV